MVINKETDGDTLVRPRERRRTATGPTVPSRRGRGWWLALLLIAGVAVIGFGVWALAQTGDGADAPRVFSDHDSWGDGPLGQAPGAQVGAELDPWIQSRLREQGHGEEAEESYVDAWIRGQMRERTEAAGGEIEDVVPAR